MQVVVFQNLKKNYPMHKLEFRALKWSVSEKFSSYLYGSKFVVITDNNPLTYVLISAKLDANSQGWVSSLATYDFNILYRPGKHNSDADGVSRLSELTNYSDREQISVDFLLNLFAMYSVLMYLLLNVCL